MTMKPASTSRETTRPTGRAMRWSPGTSQIAAPATSGTTMRIVSQGSSLRVCISRSPGSAARGEDDDKGGHDADQHDRGVGPDVTGLQARSEEHTSELQSRGQLVCRLLPDKKERRMRSDSGGPSHVLGR